MPSFIMLLPKHLFLLAGIRENLMGWLWLSGPFAKYWSQYKAVCV